MEREDEKSLEVIPKVVEMPILQIFGFDGETKWNEEFNEF